MGGCSCGPGGVLCETHSTTQDLAMGFSNLAQFKPTPTIRQRMKTATEI